VSNSKLPERASLEYLKKLAKDRLEDLRRTDPRAKLATVLLAVAQEHGFSSWRALKVEIEQRQQHNVSVFLEACARGDVEAVRGLLANDPHLVRAHHADPPLPDSTGLHAAAVRGHVALVRLLLEHGADPNARAAGPNVSPLHLAAAQGRVRAMRALLDAGCDVHGHGDEHEADVIGWATALRPPGGISEEVVALLLERGARHHIFSAIAVADAGLIRTLVEQNPEALDRRMSRFEQCQTPVHFAMNRNRYDLMDLLIELGADLEAEDKIGNTALATALLRGDREAILRLQAAGANPPARTDASSFSAQAARLAGNTRKGVPMISVPDIAKALSWYTSMGFQEIARFEEDGLVNFGMVAFGNAQLMMRVAPWGPGGCYQRAGKPGPHDVSLWFYTNQVDALYQLLRSSQMESAQALAAGDSVSGQTIEFVEDLYDPFYGGRQFSIRDLNGYTLVFLKDE
jgi:ankyrin repeat protein/catechol 2,3-dioxygenase-like lactoylglutathione lyase family enzyme